MAKQTSNKSITEKTAVVRLDSPKAIANFSKELKRFVVDNRLYTEIVSYNDDKKIVKNFVHVEGWQFAGASMGIFFIPVAEENMSLESGLLTEKVEYTTKKGVKISNPVFKYKVTVEAVQISTGKVVGRGMALCSNKEPKKKTFDEYAVLSMAQTRAIGKAGRNTIGWVMKLAGYEPTPAEEMDEVEPEAQESDTVATDEMPIEDVKFLVNTKLEAMPVADKVRLLKNNANVIQEKSMTDGNYRYLYTILSRDGQGDER